MGRILLTCVLLVFSLGSQADYLEVRRSATIKQAADRDGFVITRPEVGSRLPLLDSGNQTNGYYRVFLTDLNRDGFIYRTLVRRHPGDLPTHDISPVPGITQPDLSGDIMRAHFINVDQGDATLLEFPCGLVLIDAGGRTKDDVDTLTNYIQRVLDDTGFGGIDTIFITHTHIDHNRGLRQVVENFPVRTYVHNGVYNGSGRFGAQWMRDHRNDNGRTIEERIVKQADITQLQQRRGLHDDLIDTVDCPNANPDFRVLSGHYEENTAFWPHGVFEDGNNKSLVIRVDFGKSSFLFTGDLEDRAIDTLVDYYDGTTRLDVDVYQVGHHGSANGTNDEFLRAMTPNIAVLSFGPSDTEEQWSAWAYGHPRFDIISMLARWIERPRLQPRVVDVAVGTRNFMPLTMQDAIYGTGWDSTVIIEANMAGQMAVHVSN